MKKSFIITVLIALAMGGFAQETHFDFSVTNSTGYDMYYRIVDAQNHWVEVTYPCQNGDNYWWGYDKPEGKLILSDTIAYQGTDYYLVAIGDHAFCGCSGLRGTLEFPEAIQSIGAGAFKGCSNLNGNLTIPTLVARIDDETFSGCSGLSGKLYLSDSLTFIGDYAFYKCSQFSGQLNLPRKVASIGRHAFENCSFRGMMMLPACLQSIGEAAFKGMTTINGISIKAVVPPTTGSDAFGEVASWITVAVPYTAKEAYQNTPEWSRFASHIVEKSYWNGYAEPWTKGSGTNDDPYLIETAENLAWLAKTVNERKEMVTDIHVSPGGAWFYIYYFYDVNVYQDTCFQLVIDVDLNKGGSMLWNPIGNQHYINEEEYEGEVFAEHHTNNVFNQPQYYYYSYFSGQFDGNGHVISKVHYDDSNEGIGLFGIINNATVSNLTINDLEAHPYYYNYTIGGVVARANNSTISNCHVSGTIGNGRTCGGIAGIAQKSRIEACSAQVNLHANTAGGIIGSMVCDATNPSQDGVFNCGFSGNVDNSSIVGGIVGQCKSISEGTGVIRIENCFSRGGIENYYMSSSNNMLGGIIGEVADIDTLSVINCYSNDTISTIIPNNNHPSFYVGGILAYANANTTLVIKNCYHVGPFNSQYTGGILAQNTNMTLIRNCFFDRNVAPDDGFGLPLNSDYMKTEAFVSQLNNGSTVFRMDTEPYENDGYPVFGTDGLVFEGAEWYYEIQNDDGSITYQHLQCSGDTVVQGKRPKIIIRSNTQYDRNETEVTHEYVYEENGKVYWWNNTLGKFTVLYDFGADVGDEWTVEVGNETFTTRVYDANLQYIDGIPYKKLTIADHDNLFSGSLLSTIGHTTSFFPEQLMNRGKGYRVDGLRCYWMNEELVYKHGDEDCDAVYDKIHFGIEEDGPSTGSGTVVVYPNPADGVLFVETVHAPSLPGPTYRITNLMGQILLSGPVETFHETSLQSIDVSNLPAGMYFISVGETTMKFVKQ